MAQSKAKLHKCQTTDTEKEEELVIVQQMAQSRNAGWLMFKKQG